MISAGRWAGSIETLVVGGPGRIRRRRCTVTPHPSWRIGYPSARMGAGSARHHGSSGCRREWLLVRSARIVHESFVKNPGEAFQTRFGPASLMSCLARLSSISFDFSMDSRHDRIHLASRARDAVRPFSIRPT
jgi:hypothetical protein